MSSSINGESYMTGPFLILKEMSNWALVAHAYNPSYLGGRDQGDCVVVSQPGANREILSGKSHHNKVLVEWLKV
jgi:hypothetical protein